MSGRVAALLSGAITVSRNLPSPQPRWLVVAALLSAAGYAVCAIQLSLAARLRLPAGRVYLVQLAAAAANRVLPAGVGAAGLNARYLARQGLATGAVVGAVTLISASNAVAQGVGLLASVILSGLIAASSAHLPDLSDMSPLVAMLFAVLIAGVTSRFGQRLPALLRPTTAAARDHIGSAVRSPYRLAALVAVAILGKAVHVGVLLAALQAFGGGAPPLLVAAVFLGSGLMAAASAVPGGIGVLEAGLITGLRSSSASVGTIVAGVLVSRLIGYWLPVLPGSFALWRLRRAAEL